jgi:hypothetical protein
LTRNLESRDKDNDEPALRNPNLAVGNMNPRGSAVPDNISQKLRAKVRERVAFSLNSTPEVTNIERCTLDKSRSCLHCVGSSMDLRFFAKVFLEEIYRFDSPSIFPTDEGIFQYSQTRSVADQIDTEWNATNRLRALAGPADVPRPIAKSLSAKTIVWEEVRGTRLDHFVTWSRLRDPKGTATAAAMFSAGAWIRKVHDAFPQNGREVIDISRLIEAVPDMVQRESSYRYVRIATKLLERALVSVGGTGKLMAPIVFTHGDFSLPNLMWDTKLSQLAVFDFENSGYRSVFHDLTAIVFSLRASLLYPLIPKTVLVVAERSFWAGYGSISNKMLICIDALVSSHIFCGVLPRLYTRSKRHGWLAGVTASVYKSFLEDYVITSRLGIPAGFGESVNVPGN